MRMIVAACISLAFAVPASAEGRWKHMVAQASENPDGSQNLLIYDYCCGPNDPLPDLNPEGRAAGIECSTSGVETWIKVEESMLGRWISLDTDFSSELTVGNAAPIHLYPTSMAYHDIDGTWSVDSQSSHKLLPTEPEDIRIDLGVDALVVSATGQNRDAINSFLKSCAASAASAPKQCTTCPPI